MRLDEALRLSRADWAAKAAAMRSRAETRLFIGGRFVEAAEGGGFDNISPIDGSLINRCAAGTREDIDRALKLARALSRFGRRF